MKFRTHWYLILPLFIGLIAALVLNYSTLPNPILYLRADLGTFLFLTGGLISILGWVTTYSLHWLKTYQKEIEEENIRERRKFLSLLDHELKNPLTAIMAGLANLSDGTQQETLNSVEAQVLRLSRLVADLRKLSDLETRPIEMNSVSLPVLLEEVYVLAQSRAGDERILNLAIPRAPWPLPEIQGDRDLLFLAVHNVIDNAIKYTKPGDTIELRANEEGNQVRIEIADTGPGIPEEEIPQVWGELFRGESARGIPGSGLGLALVQAIIRRHGGTTSLRSQLKKGTIITLTLPTHGVTEL